MKTVLIIIVALILSLGLGFFLFRSSQKPPKAQVGQTFEGQPPSHITQGSTDHPAYNSNPPTSGWHWPQPANWGVYDQTLPDEQLIHNLEHGGIWISYKPSLDAATVSKLKDFATRYHLVIVEPRASDDANIVLAAWTHLLKLDSYNERTILEFFHAYYNQGPEKIE